MNQGRFCSSSEQRLKPSLILPDLWRRVTILIRSPASPGRALISSSSILSKAGLFSPSVVFNIDSLNLYTMSL